MSEHCEYCGEAVVCRVCDKHASSEEHRREVELHEAYEARDTSESKVATLEASNEKLVEALEELTASADNAISAAEEFAEDNSRVLLRNRFRVVLIRSVEAARAALAAARGGGGAVSAPFTLMAKPAGARCNLRCGYCFYREKADLYPTWRMSDTVLEAYVRRYIESQDTADVPFVWQGGEPTLLGLDFYKRASELQRRYANGKEITNALQTNCTLLSDEWCEWLASESWLVGASVDGPQAQHDEARSGSWEAVMSGIERLGRHGVEYTTLTVIGRANVDSPIETYEFLASLSPGPRAFQFLPASSELRPEEYGEFMLEIFRLWSSRDVGIHFVQLFESTLARLRGFSSGVCEFEPTCGDQVVLEHNGDVYACDHFVDSAHLLGNITHPAFSLRTMPLHIQKFRQECVGCDVRFLCNGGCPSQNGHFCPSYKAFFRSAVHWFETHDWRTPR